MRSNEPTHTRSASSVICEWGNWTDTLRSQFLWTDSGRGLANNTGEVAEENRLEEKRINERIFDDRENEIKMPSFFGYMGWSVAILFPVFILIDFIFFR